MFQPFIFQGVAMKQNLVVEEYMRNEILPMLYGDYNKLYYKNPY